MDGICLFSNNTILQISECVEEKYKGGKLINNKCICKKGKREINGKCIPYLCKGGYIINNKCECEDNKENIM